MSFDPKADFKKFREADAATLREESQKGWFKTAVVYALADLANRGATDQEINGANRFVELLNGLAADEIKVTRLPVKSLEYLDGNPKPKKEEKK
jgi:hypothetical protein